MAFGQAAGPPASARDVDRLLDLLHDAGHTDFRDARGPMGFTQRQAAGKFTQDEATAFIDALEAEQHAADEAVDAPMPARPRPARLTAAERAIRKLSDADLAAELQRRGWVVMEP